MFEDPGAGNNVNPVVGIRREEQQLNEVPGGFGRPTKIVYQSFFLENGISVKTRDVFQSFV